MTTPSTARKAGPLLGNGSTTAFPFTFKVFAAADVAVTIANSSGVETPLVLNTDYSVTLNGNQDTSPGGTITYPISGAALPSGSKLSIVGDIDYDQPLDLPSGGNFSPLALENQLDRATMQIQQLAEGLSRAAQLPVTNSEDPATLVADIVRLADSADNIDTLVANLADITTVADDLNEPVSEINTVAGAITNVNNVGSNITNVNTVAGISANVTTVAGIAANVTTVAGVAANVTTVAGVSAAVTAVAAIDDDVTIAAANVADITNFADVYQGPKTSDPTLRNDGSALQVGDLYFNTVEQALRTYGGTQWVSGTAGTVAVQNFSGNASTTAFTLATAPAGENNTQVYIGGVYQQKDQYSVSGTTLTFSTAPPSGTNNVEVVTISTLAIGETDASLVSFVQAGTGAVERTAQAKMREFVSVKDFGAVGDWNGSTGTDDLLKIQAAITANPGKRIVIDQQCFISGPIDITADNTELIFTASAGLAFSTATNKVINITANNVKVRGGKITGPGTFDGANTQPLYSVVWARGDNITIESVRLINVPKVGIYIKDGNNCRVVNNTIEGNYPSASFTGTQTGHAGILLEGGSSGAQGNLVVSGNIISTCVQGVLVANYGTVGSDSGVTISGNSFFNCWNHGVYAAGNANGIAVSGNSFNQCQIPTALKGKGHAVVGNTMQTTATGSFVDVTGISMRDAVGCVVANNSIKGDAAAGSAVIALFGSSGTEVSNNTITGNTIEVLGGSSVCIKVGDGSTTTTVRNNVISDNVCIGNGVPSIGLILVIGVSGGNGMGNVVSGNTVVHKADSYGIHAAYLDGVIISSNNIRLEYDAGSAKNLGGIVVNATTKSRIDGNSIKVTANWGSNVTYYGIWELGASSGNRTSENLISLSATKLALGVQLITVSGSGIVVNEAGPGAPNLNAGIGSIWRRTDGGAATTLYVKESGTGATGWVGK